MAYKYTDDDYCDIYENKICDNCGKCLEIDGIDTKAIKIEDIAKTQEQNQLLEEEFFEDLKSSLSDEELNEIDEDNLDLKSIYKKYENSKEEPFDSKDEYDDAFNHIVYLDGEDINIDEDTEEVYPGVRRFKKSAE